MAEACNMVSTSAKLAQVCAELDREEFVCVDTEFIRRSTYWPELCLIQLGGTTADQGDIVLVDALARGLDLEPLYELMANRNVVKVMHAAEADVEIFHHYGGVIPWPLFDTQIAASFCGYGASVGYDKLVKQVVGATVDKVAQVSDWSRRPLQSNQLTYAMQDVHHLPRLYQHLIEQLEVHGRSRWIESEMVAICDPGRYDPDPWLAWLRVKSRNKHPRFLAVLREVAAWREIEAQRTNRPRAWVLSDHYVVKIAELQPANAQELARVPSAPGKQSRPSALPNGVLAAVQRGLTCPPEEMPQHRANDRHPNMALAALFSVYLKALAAERGIAESLVADSRDLDRLSREDQPDIPLLTGWRRSEFGNELLRLKRGEIALSTCRGRVIAVPVAGDEQKGI